MASALFVGIFVLRASVGGAADAIAMLYVLPIALVAIGFVGEPGSLPGRLRSRC